MVQLLCLSLYNVPRLTGSMDQIKMQTVIFCFSFFFLTTVAGFRQQWQTVDKMALKLIFGNISILTPLDFAIAAKYEDVAAQCNAYAEVFNDIDVSSLTMN